MTVSIDFDTRGRGQVQLDSKIGVYFRSLKSDLSCNLICEGETHGFKTS